MTDALCDLPLDNTFDWDCQECEEEFEVYVEFDPCYSVSKIEYTKCDVCEKITRDIYKWGKGVPISQNLRWQTGMRSMLYNCML